jgi:hypothetical protein
MTKKKAEKTTRDFQVSLTMTKPSEGREAILERGLALSERRVKDLEEMLAECNEDTKGHKDLVHAKDKRIALLERRCQTLYYGLKEAEKGRQSAGQVLDGVLTLQQRSVEEINKFSLLRKDALDQVSALVGQPVTVCPVCGRLSKSTDSGVFYCDECFDKADWPWEMPWSKGRRAK